MLLKNAVVYNEDFEPIRADLAVEGEKIAGIGQVNAGGECLDLSGYTIIPGLIDMHIHGCAGFDASDAMTALLPGFTLLRLCSMLGTMGVTVTKDELLALNRQLNEIPQPDAAQEPS